MNAFTASSWPSLAAHGAFWEGLMSRMETLRGKGQDPERIRYMAREFESLFLNILLKTMRETVPRSGWLDGGRGEDLFGAMLDQEMARASAHGRGLGIAELVLRELLPGGRQDNGSAVALERALTLYGRLSSDSGAKTGSRSRESGFRLPVTGKLSSPFGRRPDPFTGRVRFHAGVDLAAPEGTPVYPVKPGTVIFSGTRPGYGKVVEILHEDGYTTLYAHNAINLVNPGDFVDASKPIARVGRTGRSTGPHVHVEVRRHGRLLDPGDVIPLTETG